ncbi:Uncharacterised protein [Brucella anthropi]|nr:Uncharacterised protein [Brucella anthropi]
MMPWSGLSPASAEHANEMGTSELPHWTSIMLAAIALTTDRKHEPGRTSNEGQSKSGSGERGSVGIIYRNGTMTARLRSSLFCLTGTAPLPKS